MSEVGGKLGSSPLVLQHGPWPLLYQGLWQGSSKDPGGEDPASLWAGETSGEGWAA